jgi:hypothetical protein
MLAAARLLDGQGFLEGDIFAAGARVLTEKRNHSGTKLFVEFVSNGRKMEARAALKPIPNHHGHLTGPGASSCPANSLERGRNR